jgi:hypothetical protein
MECPLRSNQHLLRVQLAPSPSRRIERLPKRKAGLEKQERRWHNNTGKPQRYSSQAAGGVVQTAYAAARRGRSPHENSVSAVFVEFGWSRRRSP